MISFAVFFVLMAWYKIPPTLNVLWIPILVLTMILTAAGIGMWLSALAIQYRDIPHGIQFLSHLLMISLLG